MYTLQFVVALYRIIMHNFQLGIHICLRINTKLKVEANLMWIMWWWINIPIRMVRSREDMWAEIYSVQVKNIQVGKTLTNFQIIKLKRQFLNYSNLVWVEKNENNL